MDLGEGEKIIKIYHHHPTPFVYMLLKIIAGTTPFFILLFLFKEAFTIWILILLNAIVFLIFALAILYFSLTYWLDRLIITNKRVIYIDYRGLTIRDEAATYLADIQDVNTHELGILSYFKLFDFGTIKLDTPSYAITIEFHDAPDPEGIRQFIFQVKAQM
ncbi:MAG: PH domain-containing protein [Candidatus Gracilibacteria bacterium]|jgi:hypothetical protein